MYTEGVTNKTNGTARSKRSIRATRFTHVHLENWRNFTEVDVALQGRVFLVGPNASGKSNFLDIFRFLHDIVSVGGGFQYAVRKRAGVSSLRCLAARRYSDLVIQVNIGNDENTSIWEYELHFSQDNRQRPIIRRERVLKNGKAIIKRPDEKDNVDQERLTQTYLEQVHANQDFREIADFFSSVRYLHIVPQLVREPDKSVGKTNDPFGGDFLEQIARTSERTQKARLRRIRDALKMAVPQLEALELWRDFRGTPHLRGKYQHWRPQGAWQTEDQFSDGTLRLLGLFWASLDGSGPLLLEEPELSLHPDVVRFIPQMFARIQRRSGRQVLISTHSSDLLRDEGIGLDEVLLLEPHEEGTLIQSASSFKQIKALLEKGVNLADAVIPQTRPPKAQQIPLFVDEAVVRRLISHVGTTPGPIYGKNGKNYLHQKIKGYNSAARFSPWIVLVDLDQDADCAPLLTQCWLSQPAPYMCFRVAVREVESWLFADRERLAHFLGVASSRIPQEPELLDNAKRQMVNLARSSRRKKIRQDMVPRLASGREVGPAYDSQLIQFAEDAKSGWGPDIADNASESLARCLKCLRELVQKSRNL